MPIILWLLGVPIVPKAMHLRTYCCARCWRLASHAMSLILSRPLRKLSTPLNARRFGKSESGLLWLVGSHNFHDGLRHWPSGIEALLYRHHP